MHTTYDEELDEFWREREKNNGGPAPEEGKTDWPDPIPLQRQLTPSEKFPVEALGNVMGAAACRIHEIIKTPLALAGQSVLSAANLFAQGHANVCIDGRTIPLSLFFLAIGRSGERKSEADRIAMRPIDTWQTIKWWQYEKEMERFELALEAWGGKKKKDGEEKPTPPLVPLLKCEEPTIQGLYKVLKDGLGVVGVLSDEGGQLIGGYALSKDHALETISRLSKLWDGKPLDRIRGTDKLSLLYGRRANLHLMMQPGVADKLLRHADARDQGFLWRCLVCYPDSMFGERPYQEVDPGQDRDIAGYWKNISRLCEEGFSHDEQTGGLLFQTICLSKEAKQLWVQFHDEIDQQSGVKGKLAPIASYAAKIAEQALRLAGTLATFEGQQQITLTEMENGIRLADFYLSEMLRLHEGSTIDQSIVEAEKVLEWAREHTKKVSRKFLYLAEIYRLGPYSIRTAGKAREAARTLSSHGYFIRYPEGLEIDGTHRKEAWLLWEGSP